MSLNMVFKGFRRARYYLIGFLCGVLNGFFGAGGGLLAVPMLKALTIETKKAHATSIAIIAPLCALSGGLTLINSGFKSLDMLFWIIPTGLIGAAIGSKLLKKINQRILSIIFSIIMIVSAIRLLFL